MPLPLLAAAAANAATLFSYNRQNFMYNKGQKVQRAFTGLSYKMQQFQLYRQDIRDLAALTTVRMSHYHVVGALELGMCATLLGPARLPSDVPEWILWHQLVALCAAFAYLVACMWLATRAAVAAESFNVRLQTQWIRLPLPDDELLDSALTKAQEFEGEGLADMLRVPFLTSAFRRVVHSAMEPADATEAALDDGSAGAGGAASPQTGTLSPRRAGAGAAAPAKAAPGVGAGGGEAEGGGGARSGEQLPGCPGGPQVSMSSLSALHMYQQLQRNWSCFDAYARVCMSVGTYWLVLSMAYYEVAYSLCHLGKPLPAVAAALMLTGVVFLLVYVDLFAGRVKLVATSALLFAGPVFLSIGACLDPRGVETPVWAVAVGIAHMGLSVWFWHEGSIVPGKADLPVRFRGVVYLDIFGPIVRQVRGFLDSTGLGQHAMVDFSDSEDEEEARAESAEDARARAEAGGLGSEEVLIDLGPGEAGAARMQEVAAVHSRLQAALVHEGPSSQRRRLLGEALRLAEEAGIGEGDAQVRKAQGMLARVTFPSDVRRMRRLLHDWREGVVVGYLDEVQRRELWRMCEDVNILYARMRLRPVEATGMPRSMSLDTTGTAGFTPAWTRISHDQTGYGDENGTYEYWVGTARGEGSSTCQCGAPPAGVRCEEFEDVRARCADLLARAEYFSCEEAARKESEKKAGWTAGMFGGCLEKKKEGERDRNRHRKGHQPVVSYRAMSMWLLATWSVGTLVHFTQVREVRLLFTGGRAASGRRLRQEEGAGTMRMALARPERFFRPRDLRCVEAKGASPSEPQPSLVASNGFLVYRLGARDSRAEATSEIHCPVAAHDALVAADCEEEGRCRAVVAAAGGLWRCGGLAREASAQPLASLPQSLASGSRAPMRHWAAADAELATLFAAPSRGAIVQLRRSGAALRVVAELQPPAEGPRVEEWQMLAVDRGSTLVALASPGPTVFAWSLASGKYLGSRPLEASAARAAGWCAGSGGDLFRLEDSLLEGLELQWASWSGL